MRARLPLRWQAQLQAAASGDLNLSMVTVSELFFGAHRSASPISAINDVRTFCARFQVLTLDMNAAEIYGAIRAMLAKSGTPIGPNDLFIAAIALANNLTLVASNVAEFARVPNLQILDWRTP